MTISHHPSEELLLDHASGAMGEAWSLAIATHAALCPSCRRSLSLLEEVGGGLLDSIAPEPVEEGALDRLLRRLDEEPGVPAGGTAPRLSRDGRAPVLPQPLRGYLGGDVASLRWRRLGLGAYQIVVPTGDPGVTARLLRIPEGRPVPAHSHGGLELTLVLDGAFSDVTGEYRRGDLQQADEDLRHRPHAAPGRDCICLAVTDAPLRFDSLAVRMIQPWLHI